MDHYRAALRIQGSCWDEIADHGLGPVASALGCHIKTMRRRREMQDPEHIGLPTLTWLINRQVAQTGDSRILLEIQRAALDVDSGGRPSAAVDHCVDAIAAASAWTAEAAAAIADARIDRQERERLARGIRRLEEVLHQLSDDLETLP